MQADRVNAFMAVNASKLPTIQLGNIQNFLLNLDDSKENMLMYLELKDPTMMIVISIFLGTLGIDRFILGQIGLGIGKLLTAGGCGIWTIIDWFLITDATKQENAKKLYQTLSM